MLHYKSFVIRFYQHLSLKILINFVRTDSYDFTLCCLNFTTNEKISEFLNILNSLSKNLLKSSIIFNIFRTIPFYKYILSHSITAYNVVLLCYSYNVDYVYTIWQILISNTDDSFRGIRNIHNEMVIVTHSALEFDISRPLMLCECRCIN